MTTAPWRSAWIRSPWLTAMPWTSTGDLDLLDPHPGVARADLAGQELELGGDQVEVADRAVGDAARYAQALVDGRVHLAPEGAEAGLGVEILEDGDSGHRRARHVLVVGEPQRLGLGRGARWTARRPGSWRCGRSRRSASAPGRRRRRGVLVKPVAAPVGGHDLERVADRGRVERPQVLQKPFLDHASLPVGEPMMVSIRSCVRPTLRAACWIERQTSSGNGRPSAVRAAASLRSLSPGMMHRGVGGDRASPT